MVFLSGVPPRIFKTTKQISKVIYMQRYLINNHIWKIYPLAFWSAPILAKKKNLFADATSHSCTDN